MPNCATSPSGLGYAARMRVLQILLVVAILGLILGAAFGGGGYMLVRNTLMLGEGWQSRSWPSAMGRMMESAAVSKPIVSSGRRGTVGTHVVKLRYEFAVDGRTYFGTRQGLDDVGVIKIQESAEREAAAMPVGSAIRVFYDPSNPAKSLLIPGVGVASVIGSVIGLVLISGGLALAAICVYLRSHHAKRRARRRT